MGAKLSRRRWSAVVAYLTAVIKQPKGSPQFKMKAAMRLSEILILQEQKELAAARAKERSEARSLAAQGQGGTAAHQEPTSQDVEAETEEDDRISSVFADILQRKGRTDADTAD